MIHDEQNVLTDVNLSLLGTFLSLQNMHVSTSKMSIPVGLRY